MKRLEHRLKLEHSNPRLTPLPGIEDFKGEVIHPAYWTDETSVDGKRVALIGYGCQCSLSSCAPSSYAHTRLRQRRTDRTEYHRQSLEALHVVPEQDIYPAASKPSLLGREWCKL